MELDSRCSRTRFSLAVANNSAGNQIRLIHYRSKCYRQDIAKLTTFVDRSWRFGVNMAEQRSAMTTLHNRMTTNLGRPDGVLNLLMRL